MPLLTESLRKSIEKVLNATVSELVGHGAIALGTRSRAEVSMPIRVHNLGADAIAAGKGLGAAQPTGWLSTLTTDGEVRGRSNSFRSSRRARARLLRTVFGSAGSRPAAAARTRANDRGRDEVHCARKGPDGGAAGSGAVSACAVAARRWRRPPRPGPRVQRP